MYGQPPGADHVEAADGCAGRETKHTRGATQAGVMYLHGDGVAKDYRQLCTGSGRPPRVRFTTRIRAGRHVFRRFGCGRDEAEAITRYLRAAERGVREAIEELGNRYLAGKGVAPDDIRILECLRRTARRGDRDAQHLLGFITLEGSAYRGTSSRRHGGFAKRPNGDTSKHRRSWGHCTARDLASGMTPKSGALVSQGGQTWPPGRSVSPRALLPSGHRRSEGRRQSESLAGRSGHPGDAAAQNGLGILCIDGSADLAMNTGPSRCSLPQPSRTMPMRSSIGPYVQDRTRGGRRSRRALRWIRRAADRGFSVAQHQLGLLYLEGYAVPANPDTAFAWFARATRTIDPTCAARWGRCSPPMPTSFTTGTCLRADLGGYRTRRGPGQSAP